ncbi:hypothetical protein JB92DRAFT_2348 [Gautieria morchelliformis]|nr:hypothetical protein JB92DRAFT_2348 [Gautieria morchelliformis]
MAYPPPPVHVFFFLGLICLPQICAEESVLQVVTRPAQADLLRFITSPNETTRTQLVSVPCVYYLVEHYAMHHDPYPLAVIDVIKWLLGRARQILDCLLECGSSLSDVAWGTMPADWQETGCFYTQPPICIRPSYPGLPHDAKSEPHIHPCLHFCMEPSEKTKNGHLS